MILQLQEKIPFSKYFLVPKSCCSSFTVHASCDIFLNLTCQARAKRNDSFVKFPQKLQIHTWFIIISFCVTTGYNFHQIVVSFIIFCQENQMIISVISASYSLFVKPGSWCHIDFTAKDRLDSLSTCSTVKVDHAEHTAMIGNCHAVHSKLFDPRHALFNFIGAVQQTVLCMNM